jgi:CRP-like cAMP-binding protein
LIIEGKVKLVSTNGDDQSIHSTEPTGFYDESVTDSEFVRESGGRSKRLGAGEFINDIEFITESPQMETVRTVTVCKMLTMSKSTYKVLAEDHPSSVGKILKNLLSRVEEDEESEVYLPTRINVLNAGSEYDSSQSAHAKEVHHTITSVQKEAALSSVQDLIKMHISKQKDDHTTSSCMRQPEAAT